MNLHTCEQCQRHVGEDEACPFCARKGRGRVIAGMLSLGLAACGAPAPVYGGPPEPAPDAGAAAPKTASPEVVAPIYGGPPSAQRAPEAPRKRP